MKNALVVCVVVLAVLLPATDSAARKLRDLIPGLYGGDGITLANPPAGSRFPSHAPHFTIDSAAAIHRLNEQIATEVAVFPFSSSVGGFTFAFDPTLGTFLRTTDTLGPLLAERAPTLGRGNLNVNLLLTFFQYNTFNGDSLSNLQVVARHPPNIIGDPTTRESFELDTVRIKVDLKLRVWLLSLAATYGITDRLDVGILLPIVNIDMDVKARAEVVTAPANPAPSIHRFVGGPESPDDAASGHAIGLGDLVLRAKYHLLKGDVVDLAAAVLTKFATGDEADFLGTGDTTLRPFLVLSRPFPNLLVSSVSVTPHLNIGMDTSKDVMHAEASSLLLLEPETQTLRFHVARGTAEAALRSVTVTVGHGIAGVVAQTGEPLLIPDAYQDPRFDPSYDQRSGFRTRSILTVPLKVKDAITGVVQVVNKVGQDAFDEHDLSLFQTFASQASVALENARLYESTRAMAEDLREALEQERRLAIEKEKMGAYIPRQVVDEVSRNREQKLALGGKVERLTILFADIVGFTRLAESMTPQEVVGFLNVYMTAMTGVIEAEDGIIDKFIGDGIMALFTSASGEDHHALRAVRAGLRMQGQVGELRGQWTQSRPELAGLQIRIGINTGEVVAGNVGSETRMDYTVVGDDVNVASRIETVCRPGEVCISESTYADVQAWIAATKLEPVLVKNRIHPVQTYVVHRLPTHQGA